MSIKSNFNGNSPGRQIVPTRKLLNELTRLNCRFRQRGSHITFKHDESGIRGTIVSGTKKIWSQEKVAAARKDIEKLRPPKLSKDISGKKLLPADETLFVPDHLPDDISPELIADLEDGLLLRSREFPQIGLIARTHMRPEDLTWSLSAMSKQIDYFRETLVNLETEGDFEIEKNPDGSIYISHPVLEEEATLYPYDSTQDITAQDALERLLEYIWDADIERDFLKNLVKARELYPDGKKIHLNYETLFFDVQPFKGGYTQKIRVDVSKSGYVSEKDLVKFIDEVDTCYFGELKSLLRKNTDLMSKKNAIQARFSPPILYQKISNFLFPILIGCQSWNRSCAKKKKSVGRNACA